MRTIVNKKQIPYLIFSLVAVSLVLAFAVTRSFAATGQLSILPASKTVQKDSTFAMAVRLNPGTSVDGVEVNITYDTTKLQFLTIDDSASSFPVRLTQNTSGNTISFARGILGGTISNDALVATINFKALVSSGSMPVNITGNATANGAYTNPSVSGATISFTGIPAPTPPPTTPPNTAPKPTPSIPTPTAPKPATPSPTSPTPPPGSPSAATPTPAPTPSPTPEPVKNGAAELVSISAEPQYTIGKIGVSCKNATTVQVKYGVERENLVLQSPIETTCDRPVDLGSLVGGTTYYYQVVVADREGKVTTSEVANFRTKGYALRIVVLDKNKKPLKNQKVTLFSDPVDGKTNRDGIVEFSDIPPGIHHLAYKSGDTEYKQELQVADTAAMVEGAQTAALQNFSVAYDATATSSLGTVLSIIGGLLLAAVVATAVMIMRKRGGPMRPIPQGAFIGGQDNGTINFPTAAPMGVITPADSSTTAAVHTAPASVEPAQTVYPTVSAHTETAQVIHPTSEQHVAQSSSQTISPTVASGPQVITPQFGSSQSTNQSSNEHQS